MKNKPLWIIVILLIVANILLWIIAQRIGHDAKTIKDATGLYQIFKIIQRDI